MFLVVWNNADSQLIPQGLFNVTDWTAIRESYLGNKSAKALLPNVRLPVLPKAVMNFCQKSEDPNCDLRELGRIIESDSGLTCELLRFVNGVSNGLKQRAVTGHQAVMALGVRRTKLHLITSATQNAMPVRQLKLINLATFWNTNLERAIFARRVARLMRVDEELAFAAALLQDFLLPVLTNELYSQYLEFIKRQDQGDCSLTHFEQQVFGWNHAEAGARVMLDWCFPDELICCVMFHHHGLSMLADGALSRTSAAAVSIGGLLPDFLKQVPDGLPQLVKLTEIWRVFNVYDIADEMHDEFKAQAHEASNFIPLKDRCQKFRTALAKRGALAGR